MTDRGSAFVLSVMLAQGCLCVAAIAEPVTPAAPGVLADDRPAPAPDTSLRKRAEDLARAASQAFTDIMAGGAKPKEQVAQGAAPKPGGAAGDTSVGDGAFAPVWGWLARSAKDYQDVIVAKLKNPSGDVVILGPAGTVVAQKDAAPEVPERKPSELPEPRASEPRAGWSWDGVVETARDWLARANRSYRNEIVKKLVRPPQGAEAQWPPAEVVPQAPSPEDLAAAAEAERQAAEVRRAAQEAEDQRRRDAEAQKQADEADAKRKADAEAKRLADEAEAKKLEDKRRADEAQANRVAEEKRLADVAEASRKADEKRLADEAEAKRKVDAEATRLADEAEAKRKADAEAKRIADEAEAKQRADAEAKRIADAAKAKRLADAETARRLKEESDTERKAVAESEATRLATEAGARRAAAAGRKPAHENSSVAIAPPRSPRTPAKAPASAEQDRKARKEVFVAEPVAPKFIKKKRRVAANYEARPKKGKHGRHAAHKHGHKYEYVLVEERRPMRIVHAYRLTSHAAPPLPVRNKARKAPACASRAYRAPKLHHAHPHAAWHGYKASRAVWRSCGGDSYFDAVRWTPHRKVRHRNLIFHRSRLYISPERR